MNLGPLFQSIGAAGEKPGQAFLAIKQQQLKDLFDSLNLEQGETNLAESKERLKKLRGAPENPELAKINQSIAAFRSVFKREPTEEEKKVLAGMPTQQAPAVKTPFEMWLKQNPEGTFTQWQDAQQAGKPDKKIEIKAIGDVPYQITDEQGKSWSVHDPNLPEPLKKELDGYEAAAKKSEENKASLQARKDAEAIQRAITIGDAAELRKERGKVFDTTKRGISGHSFLKTIAQQVNLAEQSGGVGNKWGDMLIAEGFMQLMFGVDPKALRGSSKMTEFLLAKQGGWDDRAIAEMNRAINGGQMSQAVREQALQQATAQIASWDQQISQTGMLVNDAATKKLIDNYFNAVTQGEDQAMKSLGGKPH